MNPTKEIVEKLARVQRELKAPKSQFNSFGKYSYRNCEDILEAVKPMLDDCSLHISDSIHVAGDRVYVQAVATFTDGDGSIASTAYAREPISKKGMDESQITGAASSYARKYALAGLLLVDDNRDADSHGAASKFQVDDNAKQWIEVVKADPSALEGIEDIEYRAFIQKEASK